ncbi:MAG: multifunctional 2',3'-cyclic-nucleotide 2'-phosphodiesterase/5'-nucleotidase/3'-nucleotidase [Cereibacter sphaeroides]|uniref:Multifunctional 2',3'-cyclic-nucleotide 2'-phosphodiesterase/5'-nucleotidase/3'-nucleotidase n=1 Tax=Cereibacter sphaeroides TaxID=1063 RepID=A0A2W5SFN1_CERSP|nr:MAG: multifunctional 2',3'-cyclic-nucleotide 2'-phosphodiesterase/5'-nucleotidase/3'-nucleotidase [Cereibacter sphaeroides]
MIRLLAGVAALSLCASAAQAEYRLHILHTNDFHSRIEPINRFDSTCSDEEAAEEACFGGAARLAAAIGALRTELQSQGENVLVLDAGDQFQGSLFYTTYKGAAEAEFMEKIGYDAMAVGNHEFDDGPQGLASFLDKVTFPIISGNLDLSQSTELKGRIKPYVVLEVGGQKIGVVSALATDTVETSSPGPNVIFKSEGDSIGAAIDELTAQGVNKIIALTHIGYEKDKQLAGTVDDLDAIVGGHSHTYLSATDPERAGAYPTWINQRDGTLVPVVQAYSYGKYLGHLILTFDDDGKLVYASGDTLALDSTVKPDQEVAARVAELAGPLAEIRSKVVAETSDAIDGSRDSCRQMECEMGNLVADAMLDRVKGQGVTIAIQNGGGLRASIDGGTVTMGEVITVLPFQNTLSTFDSAGADIVAALENGASDIENGAGRFAQVAGLKYTVDPAKPSGSRISDVMVRDGDGWAPIALDATYGVVSNNYVRGGGDGFDMFINAKNVYDFGPDLADVTAEFLTRNSPYEPLTDGRITRK